MGLMKTEKDWVEAMSLEIGSPSAEPVMRSIGMMAIAVLVAGSATADAHHWRKARSCELSALFCLECSSSDFGCTAAEGRSDIRGAGCRN